ncbi:DUF2339 domain-containing protein [Acinetobacter sp. R933-2]|uniref:DUF2339 domain-containing protein n=1 Tax=Acinetobacter sp. R933-2 TaxID=2746728 RepID=UPI002576E480|nr:DUF2339 domain-containing protein [Acinetobacter sp. R933-2]MDM1245800.1 DUF2339 domain-containing protein [Acinetobacter sp. R933-2]
MLKGQSEIRIIWLMVLTIVAVSAWFLKIEVLTYVCGLAFVMSVMHYVDALQKPLIDISAQQHLTLQFTSKVPLYISSLLAVVGMSLQWGWLIGLGLTCWIFFFLRWLRRLERSVQQLQEKLNHVQQQSITPENSTAVISNSTQPLSETHPEMSLIQQMKQWIFQGNPVLKAATVVLVIGIILLLRFATEHWQVSLSLKLAIVAILSFVLTGIGVFLQNKNRSFALALEGLGLAGLFLTLFFAYYNHVIPNIYVASICFAVVMALTLTLSLKQQSIELALMAMVIAAAAPFTLPVRAATAVEFVAYYWVINFCVAILTTLRPWKILNQIAFLMTVIVAGSYAFIHGQTQQHDALAFLVLAHTAIFIWLGFRFSQLIAQKDVQQFQLKPALDIALIFGAPLVAYTFLYLIYFEKTVWQASLSLAFAVLFAVLYLLAKRNQAIKIISQSYFSLMLIFITLIPPLLLQDEWSVMGWAVEGVLIFVFALYQKSTVSRYLASALLVVAGLSSLYYLFESAHFPSLMYWVLSISYLAVVLLANAHEKFQQQLTYSSITFLSMLLLSATAMQLFLWVDYLEGSSQYIFTLILMSGLYVILNSVMLWRKASWSWLIPKWIGVIPLYIFALFFVIHRSENGSILWLNTIEQAGIFFSGALLTWLWLRPAVGLKLEKEWVSLGTLLSLSLMSLSILPALPYISVVILPLAFCAWCFSQKENLNWTMFWQTRSSLALILIWIVCSQLFSQQPFQFYLLPVLNPFDLISIAILFGFIWMLSLQLKQGMDRGIVAVLSVLSLLWLSSYVILRALHVYLSTPYNTLEIWQNSTIQLSFTLLWVSLAFITMSYATKKNMRSLWILGGSILMLVTLKLVLLDLSHIGTLTRVISFLGAGFVMLIIAYIAPIPETKALNH